VPFKIAAFICGYKIGKRTKVERLKEREERRE
jgi:hypothetical protein